MRVPFRKLRNLAKTTEALVVSAWLTRQGHPPSRRLVLPEQLTASLALPEPAAAIDEVMPGARPRRSRRWRVSRSAKKRSRRRRRSSALTSVISAVCRPWARRRPLTAACWRRTATAGTLSATARRTTRPPSPASVTQRLEETDPPDLFVLDGGIAQLNAATRCRRGRRLDALYLARQARGAHLRRGPDASRPTSALADAHACSDVSETRRTQRPCWRTAAPAAARARRRLRRCSTKRPSIPTRSRRAAFTSVGGLARGVRG